MNEPRRVSANGVEFAYLESGPAHGPLALCLHGFPDHAPTYDALRAELARVGIHAVAPWMRGYAPSGLAPDGNYQVASLALDAIALADVLAPDREAVLVGHDWGAMAAYTAAGAAPQRFARIVTMAVPHAGALGRHIFEVAQLKRSWYQFLFQLPLAEAVVNADDFAMIDRLWRDWSPGITLDAGFMRALKDTLAAPGTLAAAIGYYRAVYGTTPADPALEEVQGKYLAPTPVPTLYLHGADDGVMGAEIIHEDELRPCFLAGLEFEMVPGAGHFLHLEQPEMVNARIASFLAAR